MTGPVPYAGFSHPKKKKKKSSGGILGQMISGMSDKIGSYDALFGSHNIAGGIQEAIEKQANAQKRHAEAKAAESAGPSMDPFEMLQQQLASGMNSINVAPTPLEQLQKMANSQVSQQYDPMITGLMQDMINKRTRGHRSEKTARDMYGALSKEDLAQLPEMTAQYAAEDKATNQRYDDAQSMLSSQYGNQANEQDAVLKKLGVQAASQDASQQAQDDQKYFQNQLELDQNQAMNSQNQEQAASQDWVRNLASNDRMAGENTAQDIATQLEDYLTGAQSQLTGLRGQKQSAIAGLLAQMQSQDQQRVETQSQSQMDNLMKLFNFQLDATNASQRNQLASMKLANASGAQGGLFKGTSGLAGASNYLAQQYPDSPHLASHLMENINSVLKNPDVVNGKFQLTPADPGNGKSATYSKVGQEYMMKLLRDQFKTQGDRYDNGDINSTMNALLAYMGKLR